MTLDKSKLLEWLDVEIELSKGPGETLAADRWAFKHIKKTIESGEFDVIDEEAPTPVFAEGDRVRTPTKGYGTIIVVMSEGTSIGVEHDEPIEGGHACSLRGAAEGRPCKKDHGRWYNADELQLLGGEVDEQASE